MKKAIKITGIVIGGFIMLGIGTSIGSSNSASSTTSQTSKKKVSHNKKTNPKVLSSKTSNSKALSSSNSSSALSSSISLSSSSENKPAKNNTENSSPKYQPSAKQMSLPTVTLGSGNHVVGQDIKPGFYVITATSGSGNFTSDSEDINTILGPTADNDEGQVDSYTTALYKGEKLDSQDIQSLKFTPVKQYQYLNKIGAGNWEVGLDIKPGTYELTAAQGSGNVTTDDGDVNAILGTTPDSDSGQVTSTKVHLKKGQILNNDLEELDLNPA